MKKINLNVNDIVVVSYEKSLYKYNIQDKLEENFCISIPVNKGEYLLVDIGEELSFGYCTDRGEFFEFDAKITGKNKADNVPMYILSKPYNLRKVQRRNYVRVPVVKDIEYKKHGEDKWKKAIALDLSGGGIKFKCNEEFKINEKLLVKIMTVKGELEIYSQVVRIEKIDSKEYMYGIEFNELGESKRDKIVQEVFW